MNPGHDEMKRAAEAVPECPFARMVLVLLDELAFYDDLVVGRPHVKPATNSSEAKR